MACRSIAQPRTAKYTSSESFQVYNDLTPMARNDVRYDQLLIYKWINLNSHCTCLIVKEFKHQRTNCLINCISPIPKPISRHPRQNVPISDHRFQNTSPEFLLHTTLPVELYHNNTTSRTSTLLHPRIWRWKRRPGRWKPDRARSEPANSWVRAPRTRAIQEEVFFGQQPEARCIRYFEEGLRALAGYSSSIGEGRTWEWDC